MVLSLSVFHFHYTVKHTVNVSHTLNMIAKMFALDKEDT